MMKILYTEMLKLRGSKILWLLPIGAIFPSTFNLFILINEQAFDYKMTWADLFGNNVSMMVLMMGPTLFALLTGYVVSREFQENTINSLLTYPAKRIQFILGKILSMLGLIIVLFLIDYALCLAVGWWFIKEAFTLDIAWQFGKAFLLAIVLEFALVPLAASFAIVGKNVIPAISLGIFATVISMMVLNRGDMFPWTAAFMLVANMIKPILEVHTTTCIVTLSITFVVPFLFNLFYYSKMDVHSGS